MTQHVCIGFASSIASHAGAHVRDIEFLSQIVSDGIANLAPKAIHPELDREQGFETVQRVRDGGVCQMVCIRMLQIAHNSR